MAKDTTIVTMDGESTIFNDLERPETQISRSGHSLTLNISKMAKDTAIVTMEGESLDRVDFLSETRKVAYTYFRQK